MFDLPPPSDANWASAPLVAGGETRYLPLQPPFLPRLTSAARWLEDEASMVILPDGYPARLVDGAIVVHPMHGRYVLEDLMRRHRASASEALRGAIARTADAIIRRADLRSDMLLMWYEPPVASAMAGGRTHVSGLPQAYYAALLCHVAEVTGDHRYAHAADRFFAPLMTPVQDGGLLHLGGPGPSFAMAPMVPRDWVLNGWLSMIVAAHEYGRLRGRADVAEVVASNVETLHSVISAFDAPEHRLSRYTLLGMLLIKLELSPHSDAIRLGNARTWIAGEPEDAQVAVTDETGWTPRWLTSDVAPIPGEDAIRPTSATPRMVVKVSRAAFPTPNQLRLSVTSPLALSVRLRAFIGTYAPLLSATKDRAWVDLGRIDVPSGEQEIAMDLPYQSIDLSSYPTNFGRRYGGQPTNTYHATHIVRLRQAAAIGNSVELRAWADRWREYVDEWSAIDAYRGFRCWTPEGDIGPTG